jgi:malate permease and related proteins
MSNLILLAVSLLIGVGLKRLKVLPQDAHLSLNTVILYVPLPAITFLTIPLLQWKLELLILVLVAWIIFLVAWPLYSWLGKKFNWDRATTGCLILATGIGNTSFVGFPVIEALFGQEALRYALLVDMPGSFLIVSTLAIWVAASFSTGVMRKRDLARRVVFFPPFMALSAALALSLWGWTPEGEVKTLLSSLAVLLTPLALISVGLQLRWKDIGSEWKYLGLGLGFKLLLAPLIIFLLYSWLDVPHRIFRVALMEAAMAPNITASILASSHQLNPRLAGMLVGIGVPLSFLTLAIWYQLL